MKFPWRRRAAAGAGGPALPLEPPAPEAPTIVIGDVHGRADLLDALLERIDRDIYARGIEEQARIVFVGDFVDRGPQAREVLETVRTLADAMPDRVTALMGNHERMMLEFLDDPGGRGRAWLRHGGLETLLSFGVGGGLGPAAAPERAAEAAARLEEALPAGLIDWLSDLPLQHRSGNLGIVHAAADPDAPFERQRSGDLLWGHPEFLRKPRTDGLWIVHGHTIVETPSTEGGRIAVDTGAWTSGRLTAAVIWDGEVRFLQT